MTTTTNSWKLAQTASLETATNWGKGWTSDELELIDGFASEPTWSLARALGRTVYSISSIRQAIASGEVVGSNKVVRAKRVEPTFDFVTTFPIGWND